MCGIYASFNTTTHEVLNHLKKLEYRGSDSHGLAYYIGLQAHRHTFIGKIKESDYNECDWPDKQSIVGHVRWGSQGKVSLENTHPFISYDRHVLLAHNGQIENSKEIEQTLSTTFLIKNKGETDSETIANWIAQAENKQSFSITGKEFNNTFRGTWAIVYLTAYTPKYIYFLVKDSPLYYYNGQLSSDPCVFPLYYKIPNNSYGFVYQNGAKSDRYDLYVCQGNKEIFECIDLNYSKYIKNEHHNTEVKCNDDKMLSEIKEQAAIDYKLDEHGEQFQNLWINNSFKSIKLFGCGSSYNAALLGKKFFESKNIRTTVEYSSEYNFYMDRKNELKIAITQSGETADTKEVLQKLYGEHKTLLLTNRPNCSCKEWASQTIEMELGDEKAVAATKTFTGTVLNLFIFAEYLSGDYNKCYDFDLKESLNHILENDLEIQKICGKINGFHNILILGSDWNLPIAFEGALKLKEVSQIHAEGECIQNFKHGPLSLVDDKMLIIFLMSDKSHEKFKGQYDRILGNARQIKARNGVLLGIGPSKEDVFDYYLEVPKSYLNKELTPLLHNVYLQLISYHLAKNKNIDPDNCRSLAKAITVY